VSVTCPRVALLPAAWLALTMATPTSVAGQTANLPPTAGEWTRADSVVVYAGTDLFDLVDGAADLFFEYGFMRALTSEYERIPDASATAELYQMQTPAAAYGLFTSFTAGTGTSVPLGQEAVLGEGYCIFWKGPYVGMLTAALVDSGSGQLLLQLAGELEKEIPHTGTLPDLCTLLRKGGLESRNMVFVRGKLARAHHFSHGWAHPFPPTDGVVGKYDASQYLILEYTDAAAAEAAVHAAALEWERLKTPVARESGGRWTLQQPDDNAAMIEQRGRYVLAVSGRSEQSEALSILFGKILRE